jgi:hypothetical protein
MNTDTPWVKASKSGGQSGECVEVRRHGGTIQVRDSKHPDGPVLTFARAEWESFLDGVTKGEFTP